MKIVQLVESEISIGTTVA